MEPEVISFVSCASCLSLSVCVCVNEGGLREGGERLLKIDRYKASG